MKLKVLCLVGSLIATNAFANGVNEDSSWQFDSVNKKAIMLQQEQMREKLEGGGFNQTYNINAGSGANTIYVGNTSTTTYDHVDSIDNTTAVGNMITIDGDNNTLNSDQDASESNQTAVGTDVVDSTNTDLLVGKPIDGSILQPIKGK